MKNLIKLIGIIALIAIIGFSVIACNNGTPSGTGNPQNTNDNNQNTESNPFLGTWSGADADGDIAKVVVTSSNWTITWPNNPEYGSLTGTYTYSGNTAALKIDGDTWGSATVSGNVMTITATTWGTFVLSKQ